MHTKTLVQNDRGNPGRRFGSRTFYIDCDLWVVVRCSHSPHYPNTHARIVFLRPPAMAPPLRHISLHVEAVPALQVSDPDSAHASLHMTDRRTFLCSCEAWKPTVLLAGVRPTLKYVYSEPTFRPENRRGM